MDFLQASSPLCQHSNSNDHQFQPHSDSKTDHFIVDDLLDFPTDDFEGAAVFMTTHDDNDVVADTSTDSSTSVGSCNSSADAHPNLAGDGGCRSFVDADQFSNLCFPHDDLAEFEWLSNFVDDQSLSDEDVQKLHLISGVKVRPDQLQPTTTISQTTISIFNNDITIPGKARTKRSRVASCNWASRLLVTPSGVNMASNTKSDISNSSTPQNNMNTPLKKEIHDDMYSKNEEGRKCFHCATTKTPQWRTGPMGPRTLCNACGVRYKSGRLVPEYRPAASPTFVLTKHSNSHRKVLELRRQKMQKPQHYQQQIMNHQDIMSSMPNGDGYLINQHINPNFWQVI